MGCGKEASNVLFISYGDDATVCLCWKVLPSGDDRDLLNVLFIAYDGETPNVVFKA